MDLESLRQRLRNFAAEREWDQFHSPKNLAMALSVEVAELAEHFQWLTEEASAKLPEETRAEVAREIADVQIYLIRLADKLDLDIPQAVEKKLAENEKKYPAEKVRGSARKYDTYD